MFLLLCVVALIVAKPVEEKKGDSDGVEPAPVEGDAPDTENRFFGFGFPLFGGFHHYGYGGFGGFGGLGLFG